MPDALTLPGRASMVPVARLAVRQILPEDCPRVDDAERIIEAFADMAIRYSRSGQPGGCVHLTLDSQPGRIRIEVTDEGPLPEPTHDGGEEYARSISRIDDMTHQWGVQTTPDHGATRWAELEWRDQG